MASTSYYELINEICRLTAIPTPESLYQSTNIDVNGISFTLFERETDELSEVFIYCDVGALPRNRRDEILLRLLEINFYLQTEARSPCFAWNAETERITLSVILPLAMILPESLLSLLAQLAAMAKCWRDDYFLSPNSVERIKNSVA